MLAYAPYTQSYEDDPVMKYGQIYKDAQNEEEREELARELDNKLKEWDK